MPRATTALPAPWKNTTKTWLRIAGPCGASKFGFRLSASGFWLSASGAGSSVRSRVWLQVVWNSKTVLDPPQESSFVTVITSLVEWVPIPLTPSRTDLTWWSSEEQLMSGTYSDLEVWQAAMDLAEDIYRVTKTL